MLASNNHFPRSMPQIMKATTSYKLQPNKILEIEQAQNKQHYHTLSSLLLLLQYSRYGHVKIFHPSLKE